MYIYFKIFLYIYFCLNFMFLQCGFCRTTGGYGAARHLSDFPASKSMDCDLWVLSRWVFCVVFWPGTFLALSIKVLG